MAVEVTLGCRCPPSADHPDDVQLSLGPDHEHQAIANGSDRDEALLGVGVGFVEDVQAEVLGVEHPHRIAEAEAVSALIIEVLGRVPFELHRGIIGQRLTASMTYFPARKF